MSCFESPRLHSPAVPKPGRTGLGAGLEHSPSVTPSPPAPGPFPRVGLTGVRRRDGSPGSAAPVWVTAFSTVGPLPFEGKVGGTVLSSRAQALIIGPRDANE